jgi:thiol-disulfide isomerase/thioredoxin
MRVFSALFLCMLFLASCNQESIIDEPITEEVIEKEKLNNEVIQVYNFDEIEPLLNPENGKTYIINFWAMWCVPCVAELPILQGYANEHPDVELLLVSLDFPKDIETKLKPFLKERNITSKVVILDDPDSNSWIDKIDPNWSGALPFTIIGNNENRNYVARGFENTEDLQNEINQTINK